MKKHSQPTWRAPVLYRIFFPLVGLFFLYVTVTDFALDGDLPMTALGLVISLALIIGPFRPVVRLEERHVFARGVVVSRRMPLQDIVEIAGGYDGLEFVLSDGRRFEATGVGEKMNITKWRGRRGKADSIADIILDARERAFADVPEDQRPEKPAPPPVPPPLPTYIKVCEAIGIALFLLGAYLAFISDTYIDAGLPLMAVGAFGPALLVLWFFKRNGSAGSSD